MNKPDEEEARETEAIEVPAPASGEGEEAKISIDEPTPHTVVPGGDVFQGVIDLHVVDNFTLRQPSSTVRFRSKRIQIYELVNDQLQLEHQIVADNDDNSKAPTLQITMQRLRSGNLGLRVLRTIYSLVALLMFGFLFVFASQVIAFQAMEIPRNLSGNADLRYDVMVAYVLSLPLLVYSMSSLLVFATAFVTDCWNGHVLFALLVPGNYGAHHVLVEWVCFILYIGVPAMALIVCLFMEKDNWQQISSLVWYTSMNISFFIFCGLVFYHEIKLCLQLAKIQFPDLNGGALVVKALLITLTQRYCAVQEHQYLVESHSDAFDPTSTSLEPISRLMSLSGRIKTWSVLSFLYDTQDPPIRRYSKQEIMEAVPYVTNRTWGLEKLCCRLRNGRSRFVVSGPNGLERYQYVSTIACNLAAFLLVLLSLVGLGYQKGHGTVVLLVIAVGVVVCTGAPLAASARQLYQAMPSESDAADMRSSVLQSGGDGHFYQTWAAFTVAKPKEWYCWLRLGISFVLFFLWPGITMYVEGFPKNATLFWGTGIFSAFRINWDAGSILSEYGTLSIINFPESEEDKKLSEREKNDKNMVRQARAAQIMGKITASPRTWIWTFIFFVMGAYFLWSAMNSQNGEDWNPQSGREPILLLNDFYWPPQDNILYPSCQLTNAYAIPGQERTYMMDYNLLAGIAYETTNVTDYILDKWFQEEDVWIDEKPFVEQWKKDTGHEDSPVSFKLFSRPGEPGVGILSIRGTETPTDRLLNVQLYIGTYLTALVRGLMPFTWLWQDIYQDLAGATGWVMSEKLRQTSYYKETTQFANDLLLNNYTFEGKSFSFLRTTGVSLGGGLALITGAQTGAFGFAIAGINPVLGRLTFDPPLSMDALNKQVFNVIPDNDMTSNIGDKVRNHQGVECRTWPAERVNCHSFWRIFCESLYSCGSPVDRSGVLCICVERWGYPEPIALGNRTFAQACLEEEAIFNKTVGVGYIAEYSS